MPIGGGRNFDIIRQIAGNVINPFNRRPSICTAPCDGSILRMHYQWTFWCFLASFSAIWFSWFHKDVITCVSHHNAETQVRLDYINICLSYPFVEDSHGNKKYILFYRWIHWVLLLLAFVYYIPRKLSKCSENSKVKKLLEDLASTAHRYDQVEGDSVDRTARYLNVHIRTHNGLFFKYLICNVVALFIDIFAFFSLNFVFQGRFLKYGINVYPFKRNVEDFDDYMSETFPPFVKCELGPSYQLVNKRVETLGCHFTVMELYEKIFFVLWIWLVILTIMTVVYIGYLTLFWFPSARLLILRIAKPYSAKEEGKIGHLIRASIEDCKIGDVYLLYRIREHFSHTMYYDLLSRLADPKFTDLETIAIDHRNENEQDMRQRNKVKSPNKFHNGGFMMNSSILVE